MYALSNNIKMSKDWFARYALPNNMQRSKDPLPIQLAFQLLAAHIMLKSLNIFLALTTKCYLLGRLLPLL